MGVFDARYLISARFEFQTAKAVGQYIVKPRAENTVLDYGIEIGFFISIKQFFVTARNADDVLCVVPDRESERHIGRGIACVKRYDGVGAGRVIGAQILAYKSHVVIPEIGGNLSAFLDDIRFNVYPDEFCADVTLFPKIIIQNKGKIRFSARAVYDRYIVHPVKHSSDKVKKTVGLIIFSDHIVLDLPIRGHESEPFQKRSGFCKIDIIFFVFKGLRRGNIFLDFKVFKPDIPVVYDNAATVTAFKIFDDRAVVLQNDRAKIGKQSAYIAVLPCSRKAVNKFIAAQKRSPPILLPARNRRPRQSDKKIGGIFIFRRQSAEKHIYLALLSCVHKYLPLEFLWGMW